MATTTTPAPRLAPGHGWALTIDYRVYDAHKDGSPLGFLEVWTEAEGTRGARIFRPDGSLYLDNAGSLSARRAHMDAIAHVDADRRARRIAAGHVANADHLGHALTGNPETLAELRKHPAYARAAAHLKTEHAALVAARPAA